MSSITMQMFMYCIEYDNGSLHLISVKYMSKIFLKIFMYIIFLLNIVDRTLYSFLKKMPRNSVYILIFDTKK